MKVPAPRDPKGEASISLALALVALVALISYICYELGVTWQDFFKFTGLAIGLFSLALASLIIWGHFRSRKGGKG